MLPKMNKTDATPVARQSNGPVGHIILNAPKRANVLSRDTMADIATQLTYLTDDETVRVIVISATGEVFSAGHDLKELNAHRQDKDGGSAYFEETMRQCVNLMKQIILTPKPVIAVIDGLATAAGCQLVASCDLALCSQRSQFATPGVNIGLFCSTPMVALSRNVSRKAAMEMLLLGERIDASKAVELGLVNRAVPVDKLAAELKQMTDTLGAKSDLTIARGKQAFYQQADMTLDAAYEFTIKVMVENMMAADADEGITAFVEKRAPLWQK